VGRVGNFAGYPVVTTRPESGSCRIRVCDVWHCFFCGTPPPPPLFKEVLSRMTVKVTETYTRHQAVTPTFILKCDNWKIFKNSEAYYMHWWVRLSEIKLLSGSSFSDVKLWSFNLKGSIDLLQKICCNWRLDVRFEYKLGGYVEHIDGTVVVEMLWK